MERDVKTIKTLLALIAIPVIMYVLNILSVIFIPLMFGLFFALLFTPLLRWFEQRKLPKSLGLLAVLVIVLTVFLGSYKIVELTSSELTSIDHEFVTMVETKLNDLTEPIVNVMKIEKAEGESNLAALLNNEKVISNLFTNLSSGIQMARDLLTMLAMSMFFMVLFLIGSTSVEEILYSLVFKEKEASANAYRQIEKDVFAYISIKTLMSLMTGIGFSIACLIFNIKFPAFWGVMAFILNFIQIIGPLVVTAALMLLALIELNFSGSFIFFTLIIGGIQGVFGSVLEPVMMGKSISINTITIIVMLSVWGLVWGIPGFILSVPITALIKKIMEYFPSTKVYADIMS